MGCCPTPERRLILLFARYRLQLFESKQFALPLFPCIGNVGMFGSIANAGSRVVLLRLADDIQSASAQVDFHRVGLRNDILHRIGSHILLCIAGKTINHREVTLIDPFGRDGEVAQRMVGDIRLAIGCRSILGIGIDAKYREIARVSRPHPVVGIATELTNRRRRCRHKSHIVKLLVDKQKLLVSIVHLLYRSTVTTLFRGFCTKILGTCARSQLLRNIVHAHQTSHPHPFVGQLLCARARPKSVGQIIMLHCRMVLYGTVSAMVVGQQQSVRRHQLGGTSTIEQNDSIFHRGLIDRIDIVGREVKPLGSHVGYTSSYERGKPHSLIGYCWAKEHHQ